MSNVDESLVYERVAEEQGYSDPLGGDTPADRSLKAASQKWIVAQRKLKDVGKGV